ncbi:hypothetical protein Hanom_Chr12g01107551 [Helianthus anomalus]
MVIRKPNRIFRLLKTRKPNRRFLFRFGFSVISVTNATVGYCDGSTIVKDYLVKVLRFEDIKTNSYISTHGYAKALKSGVIVAIFLDLPTAKVFLAQYCKSFVRTGETFKVGGYGFVSPLPHNANTFFTSKFRKYLSKFDIDHCLRLESFSIES